MKIAIIINTSWNIYNFREGLVKHFLMEGHHVLAIAPSDEYSTQLIDWGCTFRDLPMRGSGLNPYEDLHLIYRLFRLLKEERPDIVLSYTIKPNIYGSLVSKALGIPIICNVSGLGTVFLWKGVVSRLAVTLYKVAFRLSSWIFFQNDQDQKDFLALVKLPVNKTGLLPGSGIDVAKYIPSPDPSNTLPVFLMVSRLIVEKGIRDYIDAIRILKKENIKAVFWLAGSLDEGHARSIPKTELDGWLADGLLEYFGHVDPITSLLERADVIVLPSYREGTPRTLLEGGALGKALMATDVPGCNHVVQDGVNGFLFEVRNGASLANKIKLYLSLTEEERQVIRLNSRNWIEKNFDEKVVIDRYQQKIEEFVPINPT